MCDERMWAVKADKNYAYKCVDCNHRLELYTILPWWHEVFAEDGVAAPGDYCDDEY